MPTTFTFHNNLLVNTALRSLPSFNLYTRHYICNCNAITLNHSKRVQGLDRLIYALTKRKGLPGYHTTRRYLMFVDQRTWVLFSFTYTHVCRTTYLDIESICYCKSIVQLHLAKGKT